MSAGEHSAFGAGKVILLGEHAVVYGYPALAGPLSWGVRAWARPASRCALVLPAGVRGANRRRALMAFDRAAAACGRPRVKVELDANLPVSMGLGSSAALSVACARVLLESAGKRAEVRDVCRVALAMEKTFHGTPSGVDHACSATGRLILYRKRAGAALGASRVVRSPRPLKVLVTLIGERPSTRDTVAGLRARIQRWPRRYRRVLEEMGQLAREGASAVEAGDLESLGDAMNVNQGLLRALGLSSAGIDAMADRLRALGALGAKLTGAGGDGGAVVGLFPEPEPAVARLRRMGIRCFASQIAGPLAL
jgi:mevalonate kinase